MGQTKKIPQRKCVGCQEMKGKKEMLRILRTENGEIVLDTTGRKNGRGAYLCYSRECFEKAVKSRGLERAARGVYITEDVWPDDYYLLFLRNRPASPCPLRREPEPFLLL